MRHLRRNELFIYALTNGLRLPAGTLDPSVLSDDEIDLDVIAVESDDLGELFNIADDYQSLVEQNPRGLNWINPALFSPTLIDALKHDNAELRQLLEWYGPWSYDHDSKLQALFEVLTTDHATDKVLIFTEYKDTAQYLNRGLSYLGVSHVEAATGDTKNPTELAKRFSPSTNRVSDDEVAVSLSPDDEIRVLVATDVLSEGQNLQDSHVIINFDLPWAIIKLIQRAGRVDRIGQKSDVVYIYSIAHGAVEEVLNLRGRIHDRLVANAQTFGSDEEFFGSQEETRIITELYDGKLSDLEVAEDVDAGSLAFEIWNKATKDNPELAHKIEHLPDLIDATRPARQSDEPGVLCFTATGTGLEGYAWARSVEDIQLLTGHEALAKFEAEPTTAALSLRDDHDELVRTLVTGPLTMNFHSAGRLRGERRIIWNRLGNKLYQHEVENQALDELYNNPLTTFATQRLKRARIRHATDEELMAVVTDLHVAGQLTVPMTKAADSIHIVASMGVK